MSDTNHDSALAKTISRRGALRSAAGAALTGAIAQGLLAPAARADEPAASKGRIKQSIVHWCFAKHWDVEQTARIAKDLGCRSVELVTPEHWPTLKKYGLVCAIAPNGMPGAPFKRGLNNPAFQPEVIARTTEAIEACAAGGCPSVIAFNGYKFLDPEDAKSGEISAGEGADNCVKALKQLAPHAEKHRVNICLEMLNSRDGTDPMKGHPGYQGDHTDYCAEILRRVGSPRVKLLFDIYHVQIMDGDHIRRIRELKELIGHVHTAGNPGRGELDETQEINYPPIMRALLEIGYDGYVGQEFVPTRDPLAGLRQAVAWCDV